MRHVDVESWVTTTTTVEWRSETILRALQHGTEDYLFDSISAASTPLGRRWIVANSQPSSLETGGSCSVLFESAKTKY